MKYTRQFFKITYKYFTLKGTYSILFNNFMELYSFIQSSYALIIPGKNSVIFMMFLLEVMGARIYL